MAKKETACSKVGEIVKDRDAFGETFSFTLPNGKEKYTTWCGLIFTATIYIVLIVYGQMKLGKVVGWGDSAVVESREDSYFNSSFVWSSDEGMQFAFGITAYDGNQEPIDDPDYGSVVARYVTWGLDDDVPGTQSTPIPTRYCTDEDLGLLSDDSIIGSSDWRDLKNEAMEANYQQKEWFAPLTDEEKVRLEELRTA